MVKSDYQRFLEMMLATAEAVDKEISAAKIAVYFGDLMSLDIRALEWAAKAHRRSSPWFPKVAELRDLAKAWRPPAMQLGAGQETKLLESAEITEERRQENIRRLRGIMEGLGKFDADYGTDFRKKSNYDERIAELERQRKVILNGEDVDSGN